MYGVIQGKWGDPLYEDRCTYLIYPLAYKAPPPPPPPTLCFIFIVHESLLRKTISKKEFYRSQNHQLGW